MHLLFNKLYIENFQSIGSATIDISKQGIVIVKGENTYESNANSNGSGKSSIFESIMWVLYGKTSNGISDVANRYANKGCYVKIEFTIDGVEYTVIRSIKHKKYKTGVVIYKGDEDISGRNKSDTDKIIKNDVLQIEPDIFLTTVFMSQGYSSRLSLLSPSARKERIEVLASISDVVDGFKGKVTDVKNDYGNKFASTSRELLYKQGQLDTITQQIDKLTTWLSQYNEEENQQNEQKRLELTESVNRLKHLNENFYSRYTDSRQELMNRLSEERNLQAKYQSAENEANKLKALMSSISCENAVCPTCQQKISNVDAMVLLKQYQMQYNELLTQLRSAQLAYENAKSNVETAQATFDKMEMKYNDLQKKINETTAEISRIPIYANVGNEREDLTSNISKKDILIGEIENLREVSDRYNSKFEISSHMLNLITKDFRAYLLNNVIKFINSQLVEYSKILFSNDSDVIEISADSSKLDIYVGNALYDSCSGGEKRKADIAISLAQRDLALNLAGFSCNLLVIDEIFDTLDTTAIETVMSIITKASDYVDTIFIVSHKDVGVAYDSMITVRKNRNRISDIMFN